MRVHATYYIRQTVPLSCLATQASGLAHHLVAGHREAVLVAVPCPARSSSLSHQHTLQALHYGLVRAPGLQACGQRTFSLTRRRQSQSCSIQRSEALRQFSSLPGLDTQALYFRSAGLRAVLNTGILERCLPHALQDPSQSGSTSAGGLRGGAPQRGGRVEDVQRAVAEAGLAVRGPRRLLVPAVAAPACSNPSCGCSCLSRI